MVSRVQGGGSTAYVQVHPTTHFFAVCTVFPSSFLYLATILPSFLPSSSKRYLLAMCLKYIAEADYATMDHDARLEKAIVRGAAGHVKYVLLVGFVNNKVDRV